MKVLHLLYSNQFSGAENVACTIMTQMPHIESVYCSPDGSIREAVQARNLTFVPIPFMSPKHLKRILQKEKPDLIHAHDTRASIIAALVCGRIPLISHIHCNQPKASKLSLRSISYLFAALRARHILWVSQSAYQNYFFRHLIRNKSSVLYNIVDKDNIRKRAASQTPFPIYDIVFIGRLTEQKDPKRLLDVLPPVLDACPTARVAIIGDGELADELRRLSQRPPLQGRIDFLGFLDEPLPILKTAKVLVMTSRWEGTPICALEALALGIPIVSTPTDGLCHLIENGKNGYLSHDNTCLSAHLTELLLDPSKRQKLSEEAMRRFAHYHDVEAYKKHLESVYHL